MSIDLQSQIRDYATWVESTQQPVMPDEVMGRSDDTNPMVRPSAASARPLRAPWPALAAAAVVVVVFGVFLWVFPSEGPVPPADSNPAPERTGQVYYTTNAVPEGFVLQDVWTIGGSGVWYLAGFEDEWLPTDGGFAIHGIDGRPFGVPVDVNGYLDATLDAAPGSTEVEVDGRRGVVFETVLVQGELRVPLTWILSSDEGGGVFEVAAAGISRGEALSIAESVVPVASDEFLALGLGLSWDVKIGTGHDDFIYSTPRRITDLADEVEVALGMDLLTPRLSGAGQEGTVITTQDGEVVETDGQAIESSSTIHYLELGDRGVAEAVRAYPAAEVSPARREAEFDAYVDSVAGDVLSDDPYVIQATGGPEPRFDVGSLGREIPLDPVDSVDKLPDLDWVGMGRVLGTEQRPVILIGSVDRSELQQPPILFLRWFTDAGTICEGSSSGEGMAAGCSSLPLSAPLGVIGESSLQGDDGLVYGEISYTVPPETSVVQAITSSESVWQRPIGGLGLFPYDATVPKPTMIIAYDADGDEIGRWPA